MLSELPMSKSAKIIIAILLWWFASFMYQLYKLENPDEDPRVKQETAAALASSQDAMFSTDNVAAKNGSAEPAYAGDMKAFAIAQVLQTKADTVQNHIEMYYQQHHVLPDTILSLPCQQDVNCPTGRDKGWFYVTHEGQWLAIRPVVHGKSLSFDCRISINPKMGRIEDREKYCGHFSDDPLPDLGY